MDELLAQFLIEARDLVTQAGEDLAALGRAPDDAARIDSAFRAVHTLKGSVAIFDMAPAGAMLHAAEDLLGDARAGRRPLDPAALAALTACIDQADRWNDAIERAGTLPADARTRADALIARLGGVAPAAPATTAAPSWLAPLLARHAASAEGAASAFVYRPDAECFFRGDDPLAIVAALPELTALALVPRAGWPPLEAIDPFRCDLALEGLSGAGVDAVRAAFRFVGAQAEVAGLAVEADPDAETLAPAELRTVRVDVARIDALADGVGELVVAGNALAHLAAQAAQSGDRSLALDIRNVQAVIARGIADMNRAVMAVRMVPLAQVFRRLPRLVREIAASLDREVDLAVAGETIEVDKAIADGLFEPLLHLVRNAIDHGIEPSARRLAAGKPRRGTIRLEASRAGERIVIALSDDGAGIDADRVRAVAVARGLLPADRAEALDADAAAALIFAPGFSTAATVSGVSGRGVGMDAVRAAIERLGGRVGVTSIPGQGTSVRLTLPLAAVVTRILTVQVGADRFGVPVERIRETVALAADRILPVGAGHAFVLRERTVPLLGLAALLDPAHAFVPGAARVVIATAGAEPVGLAVDAIGEQIDAIVRPMSGLLAGVPGLAGTTLLGDGNVLLILDLEELIG